MKKVFFTLSFLLFLFLNFNLNAQELKEYIYDYAGCWLFFEPQDLYDPMLNTGSNIAGETFKATDFFKIINLPNNPQRPSEGRNVYQSPESPFWKRKITTKSGYFNFIFPPENRNNKQYAYTLLAGYLDNNEYQKIDLNMESASPYELYLDGNKIASFNKFTEDENNKQNQTVTLEKGKHDLIIKTLYQKAEGRDWMFKLEFGTKKENSILWTLDPQKVMDIGLILDGKRLLGVTVSSNGKYVKYSYKETKAPEGKTEYWIEIIDLKSNRTILNTRYNNMGQVSFHPFEDAICFRKNENEKSRVYKQNLEDGDVTLLMEASKDMNFYTFSDDGNFIIYGINIKGKKNKDGINRLEGMEDRWPWWRNQTDLYYYNVLTGLHSQLTAGNLSTNLEDISHDGRKIIVNQSIPDYTKRPYTRQIMMEIDLKNRNIDTLWNSSFGGSVQYSPDNKQLLVIGSAAMFDGAGRNLPKKMIANDFDNQAYIYDLTDKSATCISKDFNPNIESAQWCTQDNRIYFSVQEKTYHKIYVYNINDCVFEEIKTNLDNIQGINKSKNSSLLAYWGNSIQLPEYGAVIDINNGKVINDSNPEKKIFEDVKFGNCQNYTFKSKRGILIDGFFYLPPDFDDSKKYPMIVYYYGGTSPTDRSFRGRYPKNYFAANGYVVYVIIPSGATGYGQEFAARHVNNWGITVADEIIEGTQKFIKDHNFIDDKHVGCMGASYGGFMTELLMTRTNIFAAAISHAGISSIASYWGEGYWGYLYNSVAAAETFPWNNQKMYIGQSALFNADKVNTPLLLLHGTADTNVPEGESIQLYTALKLLGKECEFVEIEGENHQILDYKKRIKWQKTIMAWWEKYLKGDSKWWDNLYPKK